MTFAYIRVPSCWEVEVAFDSKNVVHDEHCTGDQNAKDAGSPADNVHYPLFIFWTIVMHSARCMIR